MARRKKKSEMEAVAVMEPEPPIEPPPPVPPTPTPAAEERPAGIACPSCGCRHSYVYRTVPLTNNKIRRYRTCRNCGRNMPPTLETLVIK